MPVNLPNPLAYQQQLGQHCTTFRDALQTLMRDATYLNDMGGAGFLTAAPFNMDPGDAAVIMETVGVVTTDNTVVQTLLAFIATTAPLWGGQ